MDDLQALLERVKAATGEDRDLDIDLWRALADGPSNKTPLPWLHCYTSSIDAAVALVGRMLPGWDWCVDKQADEYLGTVHQPGENSEGCGEQYGVSAPLAIVAAILTALLAQSERPE